MPNTDLLEVDCDPKIPDDAEDVGAVEEPNMDLLDVDCDPKTPVDDDEDVVVAGVPNTDWLEVG